MRRTKIVFAAAVIAAGVMLAGCTGTPSPRPSSSDSAQAKASARDVVKKIAETKPSTASIAHADGVVRAPGAEAEVRIDVEEIRALPDSTVLSWRLSTASGSKQNVSTFQFSVAPHLDTRNIALVASGGDVTLRPYTFRDQNDPQQPAACLCGTPGADTDGTGQQLFALLPALPDGTRTVDVSMPGFDIMKAVPVTR